MPTFKAEDPNFMKQAKFDNEIDEATRNEKHEEVKALLQSAINDKKSYVIMIDVSTEGDGSKVDIRSAASATAMKGMYEAFRAQIMDIFAHLFTLSLINDLLVSETSTDGNLKEGETKSKSKTEKNWKGKGKH